MPLVIKGNAGLLDALRLGPPWQWGCQPAGDVVQDSPRSVVTRVAASHGRRVYLKVYRYPRLRMRLRSLWQPSRAESEFSNLQHLCSLGIPAVRPLAWGDWRVLGVVCQAFLVTAAEESTTDLRRALANPRRCGLDRVQARRVAISDLAALVRRMHDAGFFAHDLSLANILVRPTGRQGGALEFILVDMPKSRRIDTARAEECARAAAFDLAVLMRDLPPGFSRTDRFRFLQAYFAAKKGAEHLRLWVRRIETMRPRARRRQEMPAPSCSPSR